MVFREKCCPLVRYPPPALALIQPKEVTCGVMGVMCSNPRGVAVAFRLCGMAWTSQRHGLR